MHHTLYPLYTNVLLLSVTTILCYRLQGSFQPRILFPFLLISNITNFYLLLLNNQSLIHTVFPSQSSPPWTCTKITKFTASLQQSIFTILLILSYFFCLTSHWKHTIYSSQASPSFTSTKSINLQLLSSSNLYITFTVFIKLSNSYQSYNLNLISLVMPIFRPHTIWRDSPRPDPSCVELGSLPTVDHHRRLEWYQGCPKSGAQLSAAILTWSLVSEITPQTHPSIA